MALKVKTNQIRLVDRFNRPLQANMVSEPYSGARIDRLLEDLPINDYSASHAAYSGHEKLRARARHLERNNDIVRRALYLIEQNVVGTGVKFQSLAKKTITGNKEDDFAISLIQDSWELFTKEKDIRLRYQSFRQALKMIKRRRYVDGEVFIELLPGFKNESRFSFRLIDPVAVPIGLFDEKKNIHMGVEFDDSLVPVAYYVADRAGPYTFKVGGYRHNKFRRVPVERMLHYYNCERPNQIRGVTLIASPMQRLHMLDQYEEATLVGARIASSKMGFFYDDINDSSPQPYLGADDSGDDAIIDPETGRPEDEDNFIDIAPGQFEDIGKKKFTPFDPGYPPARYAEYTTSILKSISSGLNISYFKLSNDLSDVNFSTTREAKLDDVDSWRDQQNQLIDGVLDPMFESFLNVQLLRPNYSRFEQLDKNRLLPHKWQARGWEWIDPKKEADAALIQIQIGKKTPSQIVQESGGDFKQNMDQLAKDIEYAKSKGIDLTSILYDKPNVEQKPPEQE